MNAGSAASIAAAVGRAAVSAMTSPSPSSVSVAAPHRMVKRYRLRPAVANCTVFVASPKASGNTPVASGSSVPACPTFAPVARFTAATTRAEVGPYGLSMISQPCGPGVLGLAIAVGIGMQVAFDLRTRQQFGNAGSAVKGRIQGEGKVWRHPQFDHARHPSFQERRTPPKPGHDRLGIGAGERHDKGRGVAQVRADPNLADRHIGVAQSGIAQFAGAQQLRQRVPQLLADPQLPLALRPRTGGMITLASSHREACRLQNGLSEANPSFFAWLTG